MRCIVLAAGYGTRMNSIIGDKPKALIEIRGRTILDYLLQDVTALNVDVTLVTNGKFHRQFVEWQQSSEFNIDILNDGSTEAGNRLGAIGDLNFVVKSTPIHDDLLVLAADNLLSFSLAGLLQAFTDNPALYLCVWKNSSLEDQKQRGVVTLDGDRVASFAEKPALPQSLYAAAPIYVIPGALVAEIGRYLDHGGNPDAPGYLMEYLVPRQPCRSWRLPGELIDVGNPESYSRALARPDWG